jgi:hypothetical protein
MEFFFSDYITINKWSFENDYYDNQIENAKDFNCEDDREDNDDDDEVTLDFIYDSNVSINFIVFLYLLLCLLSFNNIACCWFH